MGWFERIFPLRFTCLVHRATQPLLLCNGSMNSSKIGLWTIDSKRSMKYKENDVVPIAKTKKDDLIEIDQAVFENQPDQSTSVSEVKPTFN